MNARRDALAAAAKLALEIRTIARKHADAVCTMGSVKTFPGIVTAVVGRCEATLDQRDLDAAVLATMFREAREASERFAARGRLHGGVVAHLEHRADRRSIRSCSICATKRSAKSAAKSHRMPSGPLHDAAEVSRAGIPTVMMFVQSLRRHQPQQDRRHEGRASGAGGARVRPAGFQGHGFRGEELAAAAGGMEQRC